MHGGSPTNNYIGFHNNDNSATYSGLALETRTSGAARWLIANEWKNTYIGDLVFRVRDGGTSSSEVVRFTSGGDVIVSGSVSSTVMTNTWQITSSKSGGGDITANWAKTTYYSTASSGSDMTQSSGVFTFPETGIYSIEFTVCFISTSADDTIEANIKATVDGTNYANIGQIKTGTEPGGYKKSAFVKAIFDVTNTSTHKVKFNTNSFAGTIDADSNFPLTGVFFTKLGST